MRSFLSGKSSSSSSSHRKKSDTSSSRRRAESVVSSSSTRKPPRAEDRSADHYEANPSTPRRTHANTAGSSEPSSFHTAQTSRTSERYEFAPSRPQSLTESAIRTLSAQEDAWEDMDAKSEARSRASASEHRRRHRKHRSRSQSRDREERREERRAERRQERREERKEPRDRSDRQSEEYRTKPRTEDVLVSERGLESPEERSRGFDAFSAQVGAPGFSQFPGQDVQTPLGLQSQHHQMHMSSHVQDQFPGQDPAQYSAPAFRPNGAAGGATGYGEAADYYGDQGQSISSQPGVRPATPPLIVGAEPHLRPASYVAAPPEETGHGSAAEFYGGASSVTPTEPARPSELPPAKPPRPSRPIEAGGSKPPRTSAPSTGSAVAATATGAILGYAMGSQHHSSLSYDQQSSSTSLYQQDGNAHFGGTSAARPSYAHSSSVPVVPTAAYHTSPPPSKPHYPGKPPFHTNSNLPAYAAGAAGLTAGAYALHEHHQHHDSQQYNFSSYRPPSYGHTNGKHSFAGKPSSSPYAHGGMTMKHEHRGPISKFVDWWKDHEDVRKMEEYTEYIGVCKHCFDPYSSVSDAPRRHHYNDRRSSGESLRKRSSDSLRRSYARSDKHSRIDKESRYYSSDTDRRRKKSSLLAAGAAGYGLAKVGGVIFNNNKGFDDTYSVRSGRHEGSSRISRHRDRGSRSRSTDRTSHTSRGVIKDDRKSEYVWVRYEDGREERVLVPKQAPGYVPKDRSREHSPSPVFVRHALDGRRHSPDGAFVKRHQRSRSRSHSPGLGEILGFSSTKSRRSSRRLPNESYVDVSQSARPQRSGILGGFFSSPEKKRREHRRKKSGFFTFGNASSSSAESALAFGAGYAKRRSSPKRTAGKNSNDHLNATLLGISATAAALAAAKSGPRHSARKPELVAVREQRNRTAHRDRRVTRVAESSGQDEDAWESASEFDDGSSVSSGLAFGDFDVKGKASVRRQSVDSLGSQSSGTSKWGWRWGSKKKRKSTTPPPYPPRPAESSAAPAAGGAISAINTATPFRHGSVISDTSGMQAPMQYVDPMPMSDRNSVDSRHVSLPGAFPPEAPIITNHSAPMPIQQPQPVTPVQPSVYTTQGPSQPSYVSPSGPFVFASPHPLGPRRTQSSPITSHFARDAAVAGVAAAATSSILAGGKNWTPKADSPSNVRFELTERQARKEERKEDRETRREREKEEEEERKRIERERALKDEAARHALETMRREKEQTEAYAREKRLAEETERRAAAARREAEEQAEIDRQRKVERLEREVAARRQAQAEAEAARQREQERHARELAAAKAAAVREEEERTIRYEREKSEREEYEREQHELQQVETLRLQREQRDREQYERQQLEELQKRQRERELEVQLEERRRELESRAREATATDGWKAPVAAGIAGATVGAILAGAEHKKGLEDHDHRYHAQAIEPTSEHSGEPLMDDDIFDPDFFKRKRSKSDMDRHREATARVLADLKEKYKEDPRPSQADFFAPKELLAQKAEGKTAVADPIGDNDVQVYNLPDVEYDHHVSSGPPYMDARSSRLPWSTVPKLNVIAPTPPASKAGSVKDEKSPVASPVIPPQTSGESSKASAERPTMSRGITWGEDETRVYEVQTPMSYHDQYFPQQHAHDDKPPAYDEIVVETDSPRHGTTKATYHPDLKHDMAGASTSKVQPETPIEEIPRAPPRDTEPFPQTSGFYQTPFFGSVSDINLGKDSPGTEGAPPVRGFVEGETDEPTPAEEKFPHIPGGFDDATTPSLREPEPEVPLSKKDKKKKGKAAKRAALEEADMLAMPATVPEPKPEPVFTELEPEPEFEAPLSKKDKKKREKAAKRAAFDEEIFTPPVPTPLAEEIFEGAVQTQEPPAEQADFFLSKKDKKKRDKAAKRGVSEADSWPSSPAAEDVPSPFPQPSESAYAQPEPEFGVPLSKKEKKKREKAAKRDLPEEEPAPATPYEEVAAATPEPEPEFEVPLSKKEKKKRDKAVKTNAFVEEPVPSILPVEDPSTCAAEEDFGVHLSSKERKKREKAARKALLEEDIALTTPPTDEIVSTAGPDDFEMPLSSKERKKREKEAKRRSLGDVASDLFAGGAVAAVLVDEHSSGSAHDSEPAVDQPLPPTPPEEARELASPSDEMRRVSIPSRAFDDIDELADVVKPKKKDKKKRNSGRFGSPVASSPLRSEIAFDDYIGSEVPVTVPAEAPIREEPESIYEEEQTARSIEPKLSDRYSLDNALGATGTSWADEMDEEQPWEETIPSPAKPVEEEPVEDVTPSQPKKSKKKKSRRDGSYDERDGSEVASPTLERDVQSVVSAPVDDRDRKHRRKSYRDGDLYASPERDRSVAASEPADVHESSRKSKKKSKRESGDFNDAASIVSARSSRSKYDEDDEPKKEKKKGGLFGLFRRKSGDTKSVVDEPEVREDDRDSDKEHRRRHRRHTRGDTDVYDDDRSVASSSRHSSSRHHGERDVENEPLGGESRRKHKHEHRDDSVDNDEDSRKRHRHRDESAAGDDDDAHSAYSSSSRRSHKHRHRDEDEGEDVRYRGDKDRAASDERKSRDQSFLGLRVEDEELPPLPASNPVSPTLAPESALGQSAPIDRGLASDLFDREFATPLSQPSNDVEATRQSPGGGDVLLAEPAAGAPATIPATLSKKDKKKAKNLRAKATDRKQVEEPSFAFLQTQSGDSAVPSESPLTQPPTTENTARVLLPMSGLSSPLVAGSAADLPALSEPRPLSSVKDDEATQIPLPFSRPSSPIDVGSVSDLPPLPRSPPLSPLQEPVSPRRPLIPLRPVSSTAVPFRFRRPGTPLSPNVPRERSLSFDASPVQAPLSPSTPRGRKPRPNSTEFKSSTEFRPLYLLERNRKPSEVQEEEQLPSLPSSKPSSRSSSIQGSEEYQSAAEDIDSSVHSVDFQDAFASPDRLKPRDDILDSQQTTPKATEFPFDVSDAPGEVQREQPEYWSWDDIEREERLREKAPEGSSTIEQSFQRAAEPSQHSSEIPEAEAPLTSQPQSPREHPDIVGSETDLSITQAAAAAIAVGAEGMLAHEVITSNPDPLASDIWGDIGDNDDAALPTAEEMAAAGFGPPEPEAEQEPQRPMVSRANSIKKGKKGKKGKAARLGTSSPSEPGTPVTEVSPEELRRRREKDAQDAVEGWFEPAAQPVTEEASAATLQSANEAQPVPESTAEWIPLLETPTEDVTESPLTTPAVKLDPSSPLFSRKKSKKGKTKQRSNTLDETTPDAAIIHAPLPAEPDRAPGESETSSLPTEDVVSDGSQADQPSVLEPEARDHAANIVDTTTQDGLDRAIIPGEDVITATTIEKPAADEISLVADPGPMPYTKAERKKKGKVGKKSDAWVEEPIEGGQVAVSALLAYENKVEDQPEPEFTVHGKKSKKGKKKQTRDPPFEDSAAAPADPDNAVLDNAVLDNAVLDNAVLPAVPTDIIEAPLPEAPFKEQRDIDTVSEFPDVEDIAAFATPLSQEQQPEPELTVPTKKGKKGKKKQKPDPWANDPVAESPAPEISGASAIPDEAVEATVPETSVPGEQLAEPEQQAEAEFVVPTKKGKKKQKIDFWAEEPSATPQREPAGAEAVTTGDAATVPLPETPYEEAQREIVPSVEENVPVSEQGTQSPEPAQVWPEAVAVPEDDQGLVEPAVELSRAEAAKADEHVVANPAAASLVLSDNRKTDTEPPALDELQAKNKAPSNAQPDVSSVGVSAGETPVISGTKADEIPTPPAVARGPEQLEGSRPTESVIAAIYAPEPPAAEEEEEETTGSSWLPSFFGGRKKKKGKKGKTSLPAAASEIATPVLAAAEASFAAPATSVPELSREEPGTVSQTRTFDKLMEMSESHETPLVSDVVAAEEEPTTSSFVDDSVQMEPAVAEHNDNPVLTAIPEQVETVETTPPDHSVPLLHPDTTMLGARSETSEQLESSSGISRDDPRLELVSTDRPDESHVQSPTNDVAQAPEVLQHFVSDSHPQQEQSAHDVAAPVSASEQAAPEEPSEPVSEDIWAVPVKKGKKGKKGKKNAFEDSVVQDSNDNNGDRAREVMPTEPQESVLIKPEEQILAEKTPLPGTPAAEAAEDEWALLSSKKGKKAKKGKKGTLTPEIADPVAVDSMPETVAHVAPSEGVSADPDEQTVAQEIALPETPAVEEAEDIWALPSAKKGRKGKRGKKDTITDPIVTETAAVELESSATVPPEPSETPALDDDEQAVAQEVALPETPAANTPAAEAAEDVWALPSKKAKKSKKGKKAASESVATSELAIIPDVPNEGAALEPQQEAGPAAEEQEFARDVPLPETPAPEEAEDPWAQPAKKGKKGKKAKKTALVFVPEPEETGAETSAVLRDADAPVNVPTDLEQHNEAEPAVDVNSEQLQQTENEAPPTQEQPEESATSESLQRASPTSAKTQAAPTEVQEAQVVPLPETPASESMDQLVVSQESLAKPIEDPPSNIASEVEERAVAPLPESQAPEASGPLTEPNADVHVPTNELESAVKPSVGVHEQEEVRAADDATSYEPASSESTEDIWTQPTSTKDKKSKKGTKGKQSSESAVGTTVLEATPLNDQDLLIDNADTPTNLGAEQMAVREDGVEPASVPLPATPASETVEDMWALSQGKKGKKGKKSRQSSTYFEPIPESGPSEDQPSADSLSVERDAEASIEPQYVESTTPFEEEGARSVPLPETPALESTDDLWARSSGKKAKKGKKGKKGSGISTLVTEEPAVSFTEGSDKVELLETIVQPEHPESTAELEKAVDVLAVPTATEPVTENVTAEDIWAAPTGKKGRKGKRNKQPVPADEFVQEASQAPPLEDVPTEQELPSAAESLNAESIAADQEVVDWAPTSTKKGKKGKKNKRAVQEETPVATPVDEKSFEPESTETAPTASPAEAALVPEQDPDDLWDAPVKTKKGKKGRKSNREEEATEVQPDDVSAPPESADVTKHILVEPTAAAPIKEEPTPATGETKPSQPAAPNEDSIAHTNATGAAPPAAVTSSVDPEVVDVTESKVQDPLSPQAIVEDIGEDIFATPMVERTTPFKDTTPFETPFAEREAEVFATPFEEQPSEWVAEPVLDQSTSTTDSTILRDRSPTPTPVSRSPLPEQMAGDNQAVSESAVLEKPVVPPSDHHFQVQPMTYQESLTVADPGAEQTLMEVHDRTADSTAPVSAMDGREDQPTMGTLHLRMPTVAGVMDEVIKEAHKMPQEDMNVAGAMEDDAGPEQDQVVVADQEEPDSFSLKQSKKDKKKAKKDTVEPFEEPFQLAESVSEDPPPNQVNEDVPAQEDLQVSVEPVQDIDEWALPAKASKKGKKGKKAKASGSSAPVEESSRAVDLPEELVAGTPVEEVVQLPSEEKTAEPAASEELQEATSAVIAEDEWAAPSKQSKKDKKKAKKGKATAAWTDGPEDRPEISEPAEGHDSNPQLEVSYEEPTAKLAPMVEDTSGDAAAAPEPDEWALPSKRSKKDKKKGKKGNVVGPRVIIEEPVLEAPPLPPMQASRDCQDVFNAQTTTQDALRAPLPETPSEEAQPEAMVPEPSFSAPEDQVDEELQTADIATVPEDAVKTPLPETPLEPKEDKQLEEAPLPPAELVEVPSFPEDTIHIPVPETPLGPSQGKQLDETSLPPVVPALSGDPEAEVRAVPQDALEAALPETPFETAIPQEQPLKDPFTTDDPPVTEAEDEWAVPAKASKKDKKKAKKGKTVAMPAEPERGIVQIPEPMPTEPALEPLAEPLHQEQSVGEPSVVGGTTLPTTAAGEDEWALPSKQSKKKRGKKGKAEPVAQEENMTVEPTSIETVQSHPALEATQSAEQPAGDVLPSTEDAGTVEEAWAAPLKKSKKDKKKDKKVKGVGWEEPAGMGESESKEIAEPLTQDPAESMQMQMDAEAAVSETPQLENPADVDPEEAAVFPSKSAKKDKKRAKKAKAWEEVLPEEPQEATPEFATQEAVDPLQQQVVEEPAAATDPISEDIPVQPSTITEAELTEEAPVKPSRNDKKKSKKAKATFVDIEEPTESSAVEASAEFDSSVQQPSGGSDPVVLQDPVEEHKQPSAEQLEGPIALETVETPDHEDTFALVSKGKKSKKDKKKAKKSALSWDEPESPAPADGQQGIPAGASNLSVSRPDANQQVGQPLGEGSINPRDVIVTTGNAEQPVKHASPEAYEAPAQEPQLVHESHLEEDGSYSKAEPVPQQEADGADASLQRLEQEQIIPTEEKAGEVALSPEQSRQPLEASDEAQPSTTEDISGSLQTHERSGQDIDFAATLAAGLADSGFDPDLVVNDPIFHRRASPPGLVAEADPDEVFSTTTTKKGKKGKKGKKNQAAETPVEETVIHVPEEKSVPAEDAPFSEQPTKEDDFSAALSAGLAASGFAGALLQNPALGQAAAADEPEEFSFAQSRKKKGKKGKKSLPLSPPVEESQPALEPDTSWDTSYDTAGAAQVSMSSTNDASSLAPVTHLEEAEAATNYPPEQRLPQATADGLTDTPSAAIIPQEAEREMPFTQPTELLPEVRHDDEKQPPLQPEAGVEDEWALPTKKKGKKGKKKRGDDADLVVDTPAAEVDPPAPDTDMASEALEPTHARVGQSIFMDNRTDRAVEDDFVGLSTKKGKKNKKKQAMVTSLEEPSSGSPFPESQEPVAAGQASQEPMQATKEVDEFGETSKKKKGKKSKASTRESTPLEQIEQPASVQVEMQEDDNVAGEPDTSHQGFLHTSEVSQSLPIPTDNHTKAMPFAPESSWSFDSIRDSGMQSMDSPILRAPSPNPNTVRDSGYDDAIDNPVRELRERRSAGGNADPLRISIEVNPEWQLSVEGDRSKQSPDPAGSVQKSARAVNESEGANANEPPSPVESTTKDRTSYLFRSPPAVGRIEDPRSEHVTSPIPKTSQAQGSRHEPTDDYFGPVNEHAPPPPESAATTPISPSAQTVGYIPTESPASKKSRAVSDVGFPDRGVKAARRSATPLQSFRERMSSAPSPSGFEARSPPAQASAGPKSPLSPVERSSNLSWQAIDEEQEAGGTHRGLRLDTSKRAAYDLRSPSVQSNRSAGSASYFRTPDQLRSASANSNRSLRRVDRSLSGDLRAASRLGESAAPRTSQTTITIEPPPTPPLQDDYQSGRAVMSNVYEGWGDVQGSPRSPTKPPSMRKRQSMHIIDLEARLDQLVSENRQLQEAKDNAENANHQHNSDSHALQDALQSRELQLREKDAEINQIRAMLEPLQQEIARLSEINGNLTEANRNLIADTNNRYAVLQAEHAHAHRQWEQSSKDLEQLRQQHGALSSGMEDIVRQEIATALADKNAEIRRLREELSIATDQIRALQSQIQASKTSDFLTVRDEDYFDSACQKLCQHVQQWVLRFSKYSDNRMCRLSSEIADEKTEARLDNAILDGSDVDKLLGDRVRRRDVFMSVVMTMVWEYVFTRYLFGMDREQRQKLKALEKILSEVGPARAVAQWRATTLTLLSRRPAFATQRNLDTEAVALEIYGVLATLLPPPSDRESQIVASLKNVLRIAVDLSIEMRTQRAEYIMLPPLQPEYDTNGDLVRKVHFNASLMNERSGEYNSNDELEQSHSVVKIVLFPLVVKKGDDSGEGEEEIVVCPAQVLVASANKGKKVVRVMSGAMEIDEPRRSRQSLVSGPSAMDTGSNVI